MERELRDLSQFKSIPKNSLVQIVTSVSYKYEGSVVAVNVKDQTISLQHVKFMGRDPQVKDVSKDDDSMQQLPEIGYLIDKVTFWLTSVRKVTILREGKVTCEIGDNAVKELNGIEKNVTPAKNAVSGRSGTVGANSNVQDNDNERRSRRPSGVQSNPRHVRNPEAPRTTYVHSIPNRSRFSRRSGSPNVRSETAYTKPTRNGGLVLYLPPNLTSLYRSNGLNIMPQSNFRGQRGRRRNFDRRNVLPRSTANHRIESDDYSDKPYDFETANAEIAGELAKLSLDSVDGQNSCSSGDRQAGVLSGEKNSGKTSESGASGDSSTSIANAATESALNSDGIQSLSSGEYYVREKCFFDQISRSEGGPRGPISRGRSERGRLNRGFNRLRNSGITPSARRERELNIETFGQSGNRSIYNQRTGYVSRDLLVSATA
ncbi:hypothetical protein Aperf_G00000123981 [Anoplocephala perfoliata]